MRRIERMLDDLNRAWGGESWHGPALQQVLSGITEDEAKAKPIGGAHSILELVVHIGTWIDAVARRLHGEAYAPTTEEDWSDVTQRSFANAAEELEHAESRILDAVARMGDDDLDERVPGRDHTNYVMLQGVILHNTYHAGQIALLKRALRG